MKYKNNISLYLKKNFNPIICFACIVFSYNISYSNISIKPLKYDYRIDSKTIKLIEKSVQNCIQIVSQNPKYSKMMDKPYTIESKILFLKNNWALEMKLVNNSRFNNSPKHAILVTETILDSNIETAILNSIINLLDQFQQKTYHRKNLIRNNIAIISLLLCPIIIKNISIKTNAFEISPNIKE